MSDTLKTIRAGTARLAALPRVQGAAIPPQECLDMVSVALRLQDEIAAVAHSNAPAFLAIQYADRTIIVAIGLMQLVPDGEGARH